MIYETFIRIYVQIFGIVTSTLHLERNRISIKTKLIALKLYNVSHQTDIYLIKELNL